MMAEQTDDGVRRLVDRAVAGDTEAFEVLVADTAPLVRAVVSRVVRADVVDDVVQTVWERVADYVGRQRSEGSPAMIENFRGWLTVVARRTAIDFIRRERRALLAGSLDDRIERLGGV